MMVAWPGEGLVRMRKESATGIPLTAGWSCNSSVVLPLIGPALMKWVDVVKRQLPVELPTRAYAPGMPNAV
jgi:hypothetical protein